MKKIYTLLTLILVAQVAFAQPANDDCASSETIAVSTTNTNVSFTIIDAVLNNEIGCNATTPQNYGDVWFDFTMPVDGNLFISTGVSWNNFAIYDSCGGTEIACWSGTNLITDLVNGTAYKLRLFRVENRLDDGFLNFNIRAFETPLNDDCASAETIAVSAASNTAISFSIGGANVANEEGCSGSTPDDYGDVWFDFTMPVNGNLFISAGVSWNNFALYDTCGGTEIACWSNTNLITGLVSGTAYKLRLYREDIRLDDGFLSFNIRAFETPANDDCASAETIAVSTANTSVDFSIGGANIANEEGCSGSTPDDYGDIWYDFTMPVDGNLFITAGVSWNNFALYDACGGTEIACWSNTNLITDLVSGTAYKLRLYRQDNRLDDGFLSFNIRAIEAPTNDDCASAETIAVSTINTAVNFSIGGANVANEEGCSGSASDNYGDIWYDFTMPVNGNLFINGSISWNNFALYDACGGTEIACWSNTNLITGLAAGTNFKLRLYRLNSLLDDGFLSFNIRSIEVPANDDCASSETITVSTADTNINFSIGGANVANQEGCSGSVLADYGDIWYDFIMPFDGNLFIDGAISWNNFALYDICGGTEIACWSDTNLIPDLVGGTAYKLRLFRTENLLDNGFLNFVIKAFEQVPNDTCDLAETITVTTASSTVNFEIAGADLINEIGCEGSTPQDYTDIWYDITMPVNGNLLIDGGISWNNFALFDACSGTEITCFSDTQLITNLTATTNYKLRLYRTEALAPLGFKSFVIQAFEIINNDTCAEAETITISETPLTVNFGIAGATVNNEVGCVGTPAEDYVDVWYDFVLPAGSDGIDVDGFISINNIALYDACAGTELGCANIGDTFTGLVSGTNYKLRVFRTLANAGSASFKSFNIRTINTLSTPDISFENSLRVYPNPASDQVTVTTASMINYLELYDIHGKLVLKQTDQTIDISTIPTGVYFLKLVSEQGRIATKKIIKN